MKPSSHQARKQRAAEAKAIRLARARRKRQLKAGLVVVIVLALLGAMFGAFALTDKPNSDTQDNESASGATPPSVPPVPAGATAPNPTPCPPADGSAPRTSQFAAAPPMCIDPNKNYTATLDTSEGKIVVALDAKGMPQTVNNFVVLSRYKYYNGSAIVRTNTGIDIIQGGAPGTQTNADRGPGYTIKDEGPKATYQDGDLVMANTGQPDSSGAQWFFGAGPNVSQLDSQGTYLKVGKTTEGADVLHKILGLHAASNPSEPTEGAPSKPVVVNSIQIAES